MPPSPPRVLGLDVGGANLNAAHTDGQAANRPSACYASSALSPLMSPRINSRHP